MIKKLQKRFVIISMISVICVLCIIMSLVNIINYVNVGQKVDVVLEMLAENNGKFPKPQADINGADNENIDDSGNIPDKKIQNKNKTDNSNKDGIFDFRNKLSVETPYETRYFSAYVEDGSIKWSDTGNVAAIDTKEASEYIKQIADGKKTKGYKNNYRYYVTDKDNGKLIVCVDCSKLLDTADSFLKGSILISLAGITAIFIMVVLLSKRAIRPIADSYEKQKRFITDSSHELKTPLAVILANTEVIEMTEGENEWTESIKNQVQKMTSLTKNLTSLARMDETNFILNKKAFDISKVLKDLCLEYKVAADNRNIEFSENIENNIIFNGNEKSISEMFTIFIDNACKYSDGVINIKMNKKKNHVIFECFNTASDIKKGDNNQFFDRFYRADESRSKEIEGFGIGLSIARSIVEKHGGKVSAYSEDGKSLIVKVIL